MPVRETASKAYDSSSGQVTMPITDVTHKRGACAYRCEGEGRAVRSFKAFAPAVLAGIGHLPGTLHDRSIAIPLVKALPGEVRARFEAHRTEIETVLARKLARWAKDNFEALKACDPVLPATAFNRL